MARDSETKDKLKEEKDRLRYLRKLGAHIRKVRHGKKFSQDRICLDAGFSRGTMTKIESGKVDCQAWTVKRIADTIGVPVWKLYDFE